jgi:hypothetical protein
MKRNGIPQFGLRAGQRMQIEELGAFGRLICGSLTLYEAITAASRLVAAYNTGERIGLKVQDEQVQFYHQYATEIDHGRQQADHYVGCQRSEGLTTYQFRKSQS